MTEFVGVQNVVLIFMAGMHLALIQNLGQAILQGKNKQAFKSVVYVCIALVNVVVTIPASMVCLLISAGPVINIYYKRVIGVDLAMFFRRVAGCMPCASLPFLVFGVFRLTGMMPCADTWTMMAGEMLAYIALYSACVFTSGPKMSGWPSLARRHESR